MLTGCFVLASFIGRLPPDTDRRTIQVLLEFYLVYSLVILLLAMQIRRMVFGLARPNLALAGIDFAFFILIMYLSSGADSPMFAGLFLIISACVQWGSAGAVCMGMLVIAAYLPTGWTAISSGFRSDDALTFLVRCGVLSVQTIMLAALARHVEHIVAEFARLSAPVLGEGEGPQPPLHDCLRHATEVFQADAGLILASDEEEPCALVLTAVGARVETRRLKPGSEWIDPLVADSVFLFDRVRGHTLALVAGAQRVRIGPRAPFTASMLELLPFGFALVIPARAEGLHVWIVIADYKNEAAEDLAAGAMVSAQVSVMLERWRAETARRETAAREERMRMGRDLHDGVLQFLAGAGLQLTALARSDEVPPSARARLTTIVNALSDEQTELRRFVTGARRKGPEPMRELGDDLGDLCSRLARHWGIAVAAEVVPPDLRLSDSLSYDVGRLVREAVANAVRHGYATRVRVEAALDQNRLELRVSDNGSGFGSVADRGCTNEIALPAPRSLAERVRALKGEIRVSSDQRGANITFSMPLSDPTP
jgi:signal transduction histidine kinase